MYNRNVIIESTLYVNQSTEGETMEQKVERIVSNGEPLTDGAPVIHTERKDGVPPGYNIRTDRFEVAIEAMDKATKSTRAKRENKAGESEKKTSKEGENDGKAEPTDGK